MRQISIRVKLNFPYILYGLKLHFFLLNYPYYETLPSMSFIMNYNKISIGLNPLIKTTTLFHHIFWYSSIKIFVVALLN